jgi:hypothetical protein
VSRTAPAGSRVKETSVFRVLIVMEKSRKCGFCKVLRCCQLQDGLLLTAVNFSIEAQFRLMKHGADSSTGGPPLGGNTPQRGAAKFHGFEALAEQSPRF